MLTYGVAVPTGNPTIVDYQQFPMAYTSHSLGIHTLLQLVNMDSTSLLDLFMELLAIKQAVNGTVQDVKALLVSFSIIALDTSNDPYDSLTGCDRADTLELRSTLISFKASTSPS